MPQPAPDSRFESDPDELVASPALPDGWRLDTPGHDHDGGGDDVRRLVALLRAHETAGRGWASSGEADVVLELTGRATRENVVVRDADGEVRAWGSVHDRSLGRMLLVHVVDRDLPDPLAQTCSDLVVDWAVAQAREVGAARGLATQQVDTGAFADDPRQQALLAHGGFDRVRTWWQMSRPVIPDEADLVPDPTRWEADGTTYRLVDPGLSDDPSEADLRTVHDLLEESFADHFNSSAETYDEWLLRQTEAPGHRWDHWWLAEVERAGEVVPAGALVGEVTGSAAGASGLGSYVAYVGVVAAARGRGVAKGLLRTVIADAARRGRDRVGLEVDADSSTGAQRLYTSMGWTTSYVTESWHREVAVR